MRQGRIMDEETISCVLCTYCGERYIEEQLDSIASQTLSPSEIIVCDDRSDDNTLAYVREFAVKNSGIAVRIHKNKKQLGPVKNFEQGLRLATGKYIAFSDQDDVWKPYKLEKSVARIKELENEYGENTPVLVHTDLEVVDEGLHQIAASLFHHQGIYHVQGRHAQINTLLAQNFATGCTEVMNQSLKRAMLPFPEHVIMHDYWAALVAACTGAIGYVGDQSIKYRQHGDNTVGASKYISLVSLHKLLHIKKVFKKLSDTIVQDRELLHYKNGKIAKDCPEVADFLRIIDERNAFAALFSPTHKQGILRDVLYHIMLAFYTVGANRSS